MPTIHLRPKQKAALIVIAYVTFYIVVSYITLPESNVVPIEEKYQVGSKYAFVYIDEQMAIADDEGLEVFKTRGCDSCFLTSNKEFVPFSEIDAVLTITLPQNAREPEKWYILDVESECLRNKMLNCDKEPIVRTLDKSLDLCGLCRELTKKRRSLTARQL